LGPYRASCCNEKLKLNIDEKKIKELFDLFGGSARYCLSTSDKFVITGKQGISIVPWVKLMALTS
jgi:hypothetical protein